MGQQETFEKRPGMEERTSISAHARVQRISARASLMLGQELRAEGVSTAIVGHLTLPRA